MNVSLVSHVFFLSVKVYQTQLSLCEYNKYKHKQATSIDWNECVGAV